ncbi:MAG: hypothetical protein KAS17_06835, partial [Victivallaceae bacterium]|nr:hypothetical protein [Victivallaceae bacterium]
INRELLTKYSQGLIALSTRAGRQISTAILKEDLKTAKEQIQDYQNIFGRDNFFLELTDHGLKYDRKINRTLIELSQKMKIPLVATNDVHYLKKEHAKTHDLLCRIGSKNFNLASDDFYFKSPEEMKILFKEIPEAISNTRAIAERCHVDFKPCESEQPQFHI